MDSPNTKRLLSIGEASEHLGVSIDTLRRWEKKGRISPRRSPGGHRYYSLNELDDLFGKRYTRDEETVRRTKEELVDSPANIADTASEEQQIRHISPTSSDTVNLTEPIGLAPDLTNTADTPPDETPPAQQQSVDTTSFGLPVWRSAESPTVLPDLPKEELNVPEVNISHTPGTENPNSLKDPERSHTPNGAWQSRMDNILLPKPDNNKDDNTLTSEDIEKRVGAILKTKKKINTPEIVLAILLTVVLAGDFFLLYLWSTTSRIASPVP